MDMTEYVDGVLSDSLDLAFERIDNVRGALKPSEVKRIIELGWGLGDNYYDWWTAIDSEGWE